MKPKSILKITALVSAAMTGAAYADSHVSPEIAGAMAARQAHMGLYNFNLATLGGMAQEKIPYNAEQAAAAAANLAALSMLSQQGYWLPGSDSSVEGSRLKVEVFSDFETAAKIGQDLALASAALAEVAGTDLASLQGAIGPVGKACGDCHEAFRTPRN